MATIGTFTKTSDGAYTGSIKTLTLHVKSAQLQPNEKSNDKAPDFRVVAGDTELGAAWRETSKSGREYLRVRLDDPSFPRKIDAALLDSEDGYNLVWSRARRAA